MNNQENWIPSKYIQKKTRFIASRDTSQVSMGSRLIADLIAQKYQKYIPRHVRGRLLDLGCGKVPLYGMYQRYIESNICVDWDKSCHDNQYLDMSCDLSKAIPIEDSQFETIILSDVIEHIPNPEMLWNEMYRLLVPGGKILLNVPFLYWIHEAPHDYYRYTEFALRRFAESSGFTVVLLETLGGVPEVLSDISSKFFLRYSYCKWITYCIQSGTSLAIKTKIGQRISKKTSKSFPLGYFLVAEKRSV